MHRDWQLQPEGLLLHGRSGGDAGATSKKGDSKKRKSTGISGPMSSKVCAQATSAVYACCNKGQRNSQMLQWVHAHVVPSDRLQMPLEISSEKAHIF